MTNYTLDTSFKYTSKKKVIFVYEKYKPILVGFRKN